MQELEQFAVILLNPFKPDWWGLFDKRYGWPRGLGKHLAKAVIRQKVDPLTGEIDSAHQYLGDVLDPDHPEASACGGEIQFQPPNPIWSLSCSICGQLPDFFGTDERDIRANWLKFTFWLSISEIVSGMHGDLYSFYSYIPRGRLASKKLERIINFKRMGIEDKGFSVVGLAIDLSDREYWINAILVMHLMEKAFQNGAGYVLEQASRHIRSLSGPFHPS